MFIKIWRVNLYNIKQTKKKNLFYMNEQRAYKNGDSK